MSATPDLDGFLGELRRTTQGEVRVDPYSKILYSTDASIYQVLPHGVFLPRHNEDVHAAVELASKHGVPVLPRTAGSSLAGQAVNQALVIDMSRHLDRVLELNREDAWVRVEPGIVLDQLNIDLKPAGLQFGPDPASSNRAALGGIVSNNSTGAHSILYGMTADHILEMDVILSDGTRTSFEPLDPDGLAAKLRQSGLEGDIYRQIHQIASADAETILAGTPRHWRRCGGYNLDRFVEGATFQVAPDPRFNLAKLICGAEGTLAVITSMKLNLVPLPPKTALAILHFESLYQALAAVPAILETRPSAIELLDNLALTMCREVPEYARLVKTFVEGTPNCVLITEYYGEAGEELQLKIDHLARHLQKRRIKSGLVPVISQDRQDHVWTVRKVGLGLLMSIKGDHKPIPFIEDAAVPPEHLADYVTRVERFCNDLGTDVAYYAHASAGCLHVRPLINTKDAKDVAKLAQIGSFAAELLGEYGGSLSSEHGDGRARSWLNETFFGKDLYQLYRQVKGAFDPHNILNPGNIVDGGQISENLRYGQGYQVIDVNAHLDFSPELGFNRAIEQCNGAGICRKLTTGTMCPSFMVTRDEEHSTRGRANALRAAISGLLPAEELTSPRMFEVMDLCVECKACKAECPSSVDMAKIKFEFLAQYYRRHRVPLRSRLFADIARISRLSSGPLAAISNRTLQLSFVRAAMERVIGISRHRVLPAFASEPFERWFEGRQALSAEPGAAATGVRPTVILFNDTFNTYNSPQVARAATEVLEAAGYQVVLPGHRCCGRPMISKGLVEEARRAAEETVQRLAPHARNGVPIVGLEPSCLLTMRDEYRYLLPQNPDAETVARQVFTFEEFIDQVAAEGRLDIEFRDQNLEILLHGHCHQKALIGTGPVRRVLALPGGNQIREVDSGCCGMAGSFGYEAEHYRLSLAMAERRLLPAVRAWPEEGVLVASGISCRQQIEHGTGRLALHPAEVLRSALPAKP